MLMSPPSKGWNLQANHGIVHKMIKLHFASPNYKFKLVQKWIVLLDVAVSMLDVIMPDVRVALSKVSLFKAEITIIDNHIDQST